MNLEQSQKEGLEELSKHEPNCPKSEDIREDCTCPQQSTVEERFENNDMENRFISAWEDSYTAKWRHPADAMRVFIKSEIHLAEQKAREDERMATEQDIITSLGLEKLEYDRTYSNNRL